MDLTGWVTQERFNEYMVAANRDIKAARELYEWNVAISAAFFEVVSHVEVVLRNAIDKILRPLEVTESARTEVRNGWWFASSTFLKDEDLVFYRTAWKHLGDRAKAAARDKVFASMTFGIWDAVFGKPYEQLFRRHLVYAFPHRPQGFERKTVKQSVQALRTLRNRIAHHQAIFDLPLEERFEQAMDLLRWIDPELEAWVYGLSRVPALLDERPNAAESIAVIVPAKDAWTFYQGHGAYICQSSRSFRRVSHMGFYSDGALQREVPKILERIDPVPWTPEEIERRRRSGSSRDKRIADVIKASRGFGWTDNEYQLFLLTQQDERGRRDGHVTLSSELANQRTGRGSAWVRRQRYVAVAALRSAESLGDLDQH